MTAWFRRTRGDNRSFGGIGSPRKWKNRKASGETLLKRRRVSKGLSGERIVQVKQEKVDRLEMDQVEENSSNEAEGSMGPSGSE